MDFTFRKLTLKDTDNYRALRLLSYQESPYAFSESYEDECQKSNQDFEKEIIQETYPEEYFILGCFDEINLVGFVKFSRDQRTKGWHKAMIYAMYVHPDFRKKGMGEDLVNRIIIIAKQMQGLEQIHLWVLHYKDISAANFYKKLGFKSMSRVIDDLKIGAEYFDAEYMVLYLKV